MTDFDEFKWTAGTLREKYGNSIPDDIFKYSGSLTFITKCYEYTEGTKQQPNDPDGYYKNLARNYRLFWALKSFYDTKPNKVAFVEYIKKARPTCWTDMEGFTAASDHIKLVWILIMLNLQERHMDNFVKFMHQNVEIKNELFNRIMACYRYSDNMNRIQLGEEIESDGFKGCIPDEWLCSDFYQCDREKKVLYISHLTYILKFKPLEEFILAKPNEVNFLETARVPRLRFECPIMEHSWEAPILFERNGIIKLREVVGIPIILQLSQNDVLKAIFYVANNSNSELTVNQTLNFDKNYIQNCIINSEIPHSIMSFLHSTEPRAEEIMTLPGSQKTLHYEYSPARSPEYVVMYSNNPLGDIPDELHFTI